MADAPRIAANKPANGILSPWRADQRCLSPVAPLETWREALTSMIIFSAAVIARRGVSIAGYPLAAAFDLHRSA